MVVDFNELYLVLKDCCTVSIVYMLFTLILIKLVTDDDVVLFMKGTPDEPRVSGRQYSTS